jgi:hypothetical protein
LRGNLEHCSRTCLEADPAGPDAAVDPDERTAPIEKEEVEQEAHAERVNARAPRDQQSGSRFLLVEQCQAEQARAEARRFANLEAESARNRQTS